MANRATQIVNFYETTLTGLLASAGTSCNVASSPGVNASLGDENTWFYLVIDPDNSSNREVVVVKTSTGTNFSLIERDLESAHSGTPPDHQSTTTVRMAVLAQHIKDQNDRVATNITSLTSALSTFNTDSAAALTTHNTNSAAAITTHNTNSTNAINTHNTSSSAAITTHNTNSTAAINTFNTNAQAAIDAIDPQHVTELFTNATDGTGITVDNAADQLIVYDNDVTTGKKINVSQIGPSIPLSQLAAPAAAVDVNDQELKKFVAKDFAEDIATTSDSGTSFTSNTLTLDVQDGNVFSITLDNNVTTWNISNLVAGKATTISVILKQDGTGSRLMNATQINSTTFKTVDAGGLTLTTDASAIDIVTVVFDGTDYFVFSQLKMA